MIRRTKKALGALLLFSGFLPGIPAFQWPVKDIVLKQTFGENNQGSFLTGIVLGGTRQEVRPVEEGEVVFFFNEEDQYAPIPSGMGNFAAIRHDRSLFSIYSHLEAISLETSSEKASPERAGPEKAGPAEGQEKGRSFHLGREDAFGWTGRSGDAPGLQLGLEIVDLEFDQMVNPLKTLPPLQDSIRPAVGEVFVRAGGRWEPAAGGRTVRSGEQELAVEIWDQSQWVRYHRPMAPYRINIFANGQEIFFQVFDAIESKNGGLYLVSRQGQRSFSELYTPEGYFLVGRQNYPPGEISLEIIASDFQGNRTVKTLSYRAAPD